VFGEGGVSAWAVIMRVLSAPSIATFNPELAFIVLSSPAVDLRHRQRPPMRQPKVEGGKFAVNGCAG
jgi:hypothetical protein